MLDDPLSTRRAQTRRRTVLRPGLRVVRRDDRHLQIGLDPPHRLIVEDGPEVRRVLSDLASGGNDEPTSPTGHQVLARLAEAGLLVDAAGLDRALTGAADRAATLACFAEYGDEASARLATRAATRVSVDAPADLGQVAVRLLRAAGVGVVDAGETPAVALVITHGEIAREVLDPMVRAGWPHLLIGSGSGDVTIGPFVVPGVTACRRCVDAHLGESDPRRAMVVGQCADTRGQGLGPRDPVLLTMAVAWAVRDLVSFVDGDRPVTWSTTVSLASGLELERQRWTRHPHCGCSWGGALSTTWQAG